MDTDAVQAWLDAYVDAWRSNDPALIGALFTEEATYGYNPWDEPLRGREAIVADWIDEPDPPGSWEATYRPLLIDGDRAVARGRTEYADGKTYWNLFVLRFAPDGRCAEFVEWYMRQRKPAPG